MNRSDNAPSDKTNPEASHLEKAAAGSIVSSDQSYISLSDSQECEIARRVQSIRSETAKGRPATEVFREFREKLS